jgi:hypothetical protein
VTLDNIYDKETLPKGPEDEIIPTRIAKLDEHRKFLESQVAMLRAEISGNLADREILYRRAKELHITTDKEYKIVEVPVYPNKKVDVAALKRLAPEKYEKIVTNLKELAEEKLKDQINKIQVTISLDAVKAFIKDKALLAMIIPEPSVPTEYKITVVKRK